MIELLFEILTKVNRRVIKITNRIFYRVLLKKLGKGSYIRKGVNISGNPKRIVIGYSFQVYEKCFFGVSKNGFIELGNNGLLGVGCYLNASMGKIIIGDNVAIGPFCKFFSYSHHYEEGELFINKSIIADVVVEDNVFIGSNCVFVPGVKVKRNSVVAAGAVVTKDVEEGTMVGGVPARFIKKLK